MKTNLLQAAVSGMKYSGKFVRLGLGSLLDILKQDILAPLRVKDILWGYDHPLVKLGKDIMPPERRFPFELFGLLVGVRKTYNETSIEEIKALIFTAVRYLCHFAPYTKAHEGLTCTFCLPNFSW